MARNYQIDAQAAQHITNWVRKRIVIQAASVILTAKVQAYSSAALWIDPQGTRVPWFTDGSRGAAGIFYETKAPHP
ncbi:hypothetical protein CJO94_24210 (plasmid) [Ralstonia solanacearum]|nr:hypothetical protein CJO94_24210 [Ralstonia solanacearum]